MSLPEIGSSQQVHRCSGLHLKTGLLAFDAEHLGLPLVAHISGASARFAAAYLFVESIPATKELAGRANVRVSRRVAFERVRLIAVFCPAHR